MKFFLCSGYYLLCTGNLAVIIAVVDDDNDDLDDNVDNDDDVVQIRV